MDHRTEAISELEGEIMLLDREWKIALNSEGTPYLLFDVQRDPNEVNNLVTAPEMQETVSRLRLRILERLIQTRTQK